MITAISLETAAMVEGVEEAVAGGGPGPDRGRQGEREDLHPDQEADLLSDNKEEIGRNLHGDHTLPFNKRDQFHGAGPDLTIREVQVLANNSIKHSLQHN